MWRTLVETEMEVRRKYERLDEFSDPSAQSLKELKLKIETIERVLRYLRENGLEPGVPENDPHEPRLIGELARFRLRGGIRDVSQSRRTLRVHRPKEGC